MGELRSAGFPGKCEKLEKDLRGASKAKPDPISPSLPEKLGTLGTFRWAIPWMAILVFFMWPHKVPVLSSSATLGSRPCLESGGFDHSPKNWTPALLVLGRRHWMLRWRDHCWDLNNFQMVVGVENNKFCYEFMRLWCRNLVIHFFLPGIQCHPWWQIWLLSSQGPDEVHQQWIS